MFLYFFYFPHLFYSGKDNKMTMFFSETNLHNHNTNLSSLKKRRPCKKVKEAFEKLFEEGLRSEKALSRYLKSLQNELGEKYALMKGDRRIAPDYMWVYRLHSKLFSGKYGKGAHDMFYFFFKFVNNYNEKTGSLNAVFYDFDDDDKNFAVIIQTPLMRRICELVAQAAEVLFVDSSGTMDRIGCRVLLFLTNSCVGGLPIGIFMYSSETERVIRQCIILFKEKILNRKSFFGQGICGPKVIMTDDSFALRNAFSVEFSNSILLLCIFHVLQNVWRNLYNKDFGVDNMCERKRIFTSFKKAVYAPNIEEFKKGLLSSKSTSAKVNNYFLKLSIRQEEWALCYRRDKILRGQNTNNISEAAMRILKDKIMQRQKAYTPAQLLESLLDNFDDHYRNKMINIANGRVPSYLNAKRNWVSTQLVNLKILDSDLENSVS